MECQESSCCHSASEVFTDSLLRNGSSARVAKVPQALLIPEVLLVFKRLLANVLENYDKCLASLRLSMHDCDWILIQPYRTGPQDPSPPPDSYRSDVYFAMNEYLTCLVLLTIQYRVIYMTYNRYHRKTCKGKTQC